MRALAMSLLLLSACKPPAPAGPPVGRPGPDGAVQIRATAEGFEPSRIEVPAGQPVKLVFTRTVEKTCMTGVIFPDLNIRQDLPVGTPVTVELPAGRAGTVHFQCPMAMGQGTVVTLPRS